MVKCYRVLILLMKKDDTRLWMRRSVVTFEKSVSINKDIKSCTERGEWVMRNITSFPSSQSLP